MINGEKKIKNEHDLNVFLFFFTTKNAIGKRKHTNVHTLVSTVTN